MTERSIPLVPVAGTSPFSIHLVLDPEGGSDAGAPFVRVGSRDLRSRVFLGLLKSETGLVLERLAIRMPLEDPFAGDFPDAVDRPLNPGLDEIWKRMTLDLVRTNEAPGRFAELVWPAVPPDGDPPRLPSLLWAPSAGRLLPIPCPTCFGPLRTCRDDGRLAEAGLPPFTISTDRFLFCPACAAAGEPLRFWADRAPKTEGVFEGRFALLDELRVDLAQGIRGAREGGKELPWPAAATPSLEALPEAKAAPRKGKAGPPGAAPWVPFTFHDTPALVTRLAPFGLDDFADLLGGRPVETIPSARLLPGWPAPPRSLFAGEGAGTDLVEILSLKLSLFAQVVAALGDYYRLLGTPHLDLRPAHVVVEPVPTGDELPALWSFRARLLGSSASRRCSLGDGLDLVLPPTDPEVPFASTAIREFRLVAPRPGGFLLDRLVEDTVGDRGPQYRIEGRLTDVHGIYPRPSTRDWIFLVWPEEVLGLGFRTLVVRMDPRSTGTPTTELRVTSERISLPADAPARFARAVGLRFPPLRYKLYPVFNVPEDLHALGQLLFRLLFVNDRQDLRTIAEAVDRILSKITSSEVSLPRGVAFSMEEALGRALEEFSTVFGKSNVFYEEASRVAGRPDALPDELWFETLRLAFRLVARVPGFGFCGSAADFDGHHPVARLEEVSSETAALLARLRSLLFHRQGANLEIQSTIAELETELEGG